MHLDRGVRLGRREEPFDAEGPQDVRERPMTGDLAARIDHDAVRVHARGIAADSRVDEKTFRGPGEEGRIAKLVVVDRFLDLLRGVSGGCIPRTITPRFFRALSRGKSSLEESRHFAQKCKRPCSPQSGSMQTVPATGRRAGPRASPIRSVETAGYERTFWKLNRSGPKIGFELP